MGAGGALIAARSELDMFGNFCGALDGAFKNEVVVGGLLREKKVLWLGFKGCGVRGAQRRGA